MKNQKSVKTIKYVNDSTKRVIIEESYTTNKEKNTILAVMKFLKKQNKGKYSIVKEN